MGRETVTSIGERIRQRRMETRFSRSQEALADAVDVARETVNQWENDRQRPAGDNLTRLAEVLGVSEEWLLEGGNRRGSDDPVPLRPAEGFRQDPEAKPASRILQLLEEKAGRERVAQMLATKTLIEAAYSLAMADQWPKDDIRKLDSLRDELLGI